MKLHVKYKKKLKSPIKGIIIYQISKKVSTVTCLWNLC